MVKVASLVTIKSGIDNVLLVQSKEIAITDAVLLVDNLSFVSHLVSYSFTNIFNDDVTGCQVFMSEEAIPVDLTRSHFHSLRLSL